MTQFLNTNGRAAEDYYARKAREAEFSIDHKQVPPAKGFDFIIFPFKGKRKVFDVNELEAITLSNETARKLALVVQEGRTAYMQFNKKQFQELKAANLVEQQAGGISLTAKGQALAENLLPKVVSVTKQIGNDTRSSQTSFHKAI